MTVNVSTVMASIGTALATIPGLRAFDFAPKNAVPPFAFPVPPETVEYDHTYRDGFDRMTIPVWVGVGNVVDRASWDAIAPYAARDGAKSVKAALESAAIGSSVRVTQCTFQTIELAGAQFAGAVFSVDVLA